MVLILTDDDLHRAIVWEDSAPEQFRVHVWHGLPADMHPGAPLTWALGLRTSQYEVPGCAADPVEALEHMLAKMEAVRSLTPSRP